MIQVGRGDVVDIDLEPVRGHEIGKTRPAVVIQNDIGNRYSPLVIVAPIRGAEHIKKLYPVNVLAPKGVGGLKKDSIVHVIRSKASINRESPGKEDAFPLKSYMTWISR